jgi:hypothetical protein
MIFIKFSGDRSHFNAAKNGSVVQPSEENLTEEKNIGF